MNDRQPTRARCTAEKTHHRRRQSRGNPTFFSSVLA